MYPSGVKWGSDFFARRKSAFPRQSSSFFPQFFYEVAIIACLVDFRISPSAVCHYDCVVFAFETRKLPGTAAAPPGGMPVYFFASVSRVTGLTHLVEAGRVSGFDR